MSLFDSGIRPAVDDFLLAKAAEVRDYGDYWSASSAGYCMRKNIFERMGVPHVAEDARKQRVFSAGDIFHEWLQRITKDAGLSIVQEVELQDEDLMIRGHIDDLVLVNDHLILYDYKSQSSRAFNYNHQQMSHYHKMQLGTYMFMLRKTHRLDKHDIGDFKVEDLPLYDLSEGRILKISKDDLRLTEEQLLWTPDLEKEVVGYWTALNGYWAAQKIPRCTCADYENGFLAKEKFNPFFYNGEPCSLDWMKKTKEEGLWQHPDAKK